MYIIRLNLKYVLGSQRGDQEEDRNTSRFLWTVASGALHQVHLADCKAATLGRRLNKTNIAIHRQLFLLYL